MKLILTLDVTGLGGPGDVVEVKDGYGRNFLLPRGLAVVWTRGGEKQVTQIKRAQKVREVRDRAHANEIKQALEALAITLPAHAGDSGKLFGSVTSADIADAVKAAGGPVLDKRKVALPKPIKSVGKHSATVEIHPEVTATVVVEVVAGVVNGLASVHGAASLAEARRLLSERAFDLVILDLGLPRMHGLEVLRALRGRGSALPVLILTAADSVEQRVKGLDLGADDYMAKPFSLQELEARVRALTRRGLGTASSVIKHGPLSFDATGRVAYINEQMVELSARELSLLESGLHGLTVA